MAQQLIGTRRTSSRDMVSIVVVHFHLIPSPPAPPPHPPPSSMPCPASDAFPSQKHSVMSCVSTISIKNSELSHVVMLRVLLSVSSWLSQSLFFSHGCTAVPSFFHPPAQACSSFTFHLFLRTNPCATHAPHCSSVYPPQSALAESGGLYCLHGCVNI